jgi:hypothetical protein
MLESMLQDTCIPISYDLNFERYSLKASLSCCVSGSRYEGLSYIPGIVKLWESTGRAGGLPWINKSNLPVKKATI